ncbi:MAG: class I SAM-dependent methyltransferase [Leptolyngbya sp. SIO4C1]|nr:class I SAM-dependent methyltransferase [Leptolyngbya sp. SIO4C1]
MTGFQTGYQTDLAYIHDAGFSGYVLGALPGILEILDDCCSPGDRVVDLGCGGGLSTQRFVKAGYQVLGIDISPAMIDLAQQRVPAANFQVGSCLKVKLPTCRAVVAIGECLNYCLDPDSSAETLQLFLQNVYAALKPGGCLIFDLLEPSPDQVDQVIKGFTEGEGWLVLYEKSEDRSQLLTRRIITFRQVGEAYRRSDETHRQQLYHSAEVESWLSQAGFEVNSSNSYGTFQLPSAHRAFVARKR